MTPIHLRNLPPPDETFDHPTFLSYLASWIKPVRYLELGVRDGRTFVQIAPFCQEAIGVDLVQPPILTTNPKIKFYIGSTDNYFASLTDEVFDMVFIDADHSHEQSLRDFLNVAPRVVEDGFIFFHDTYPCQPYMFAQDKSHTCYKTPLFIKERLINEFEILTLPFNPGVTIVKKIARNKQLAYELSN